MFLGHIGKENPNYKVVVKLSEIDGVVFGIIARKDENTANVSNFIDLLLKGLNYVLPSFGFITGKTDHDEKVITTAETDGLPADDSVIEDNGIDEVNVKQTDNAVLDVSNPVELAELYGAAFKDPVSRRGKLKAMTVDGVKLAVAKFDKFEYLPIRTSQNLISMTREITDSNYGNQTEIMTLPPLITACFFISESGTPESRFARSPKYGADFGNFGNIQHKITKKHKGKFVYTKTNTDWDFIVVGSDVTYEKQSYMTFNPGFTSYNRALRFFISFMYTSGYWKAYIEAFVQLNKEKPLGLIEAFLMSLHAKKYFTGTKDRPATKIAADAELIFKKHQTREAVLNDLKTAEDLTVRMLAYAKAVKNESLANYCTAVLNAFAAQNTWINKLSWMYDWTNV